MTVSSTGPGSVFLGVIGRVRLPLGSTVPTGSIYSGEAVGVVQLSAALAPSGTMYPTRL